ncbi:6-phosphogluconolactonase [Limnohabitans sp. TS-CS-82]|uniref:6-phosphogluconolactonase n=1 Tax=Limnohabitans sp. TS-CS-82 TaxID=2094193 RepID=UPI000CF2667A|nr:6-phosphogluconolactonase [Limnohabitans sp. TS-CS-82]PQA84037.1 6-phosphogluconolactonase [Limnohabitans sp. TS-CS-82]
MTSTWHPESRGTLTVHTVSAAELNVRLAQDIAQRLAAAIQARGFAVLSVSGGKSPVALFEALCVIDIDWSRVRITLVDERCVPRSHPDSNALLVQTHLLQDLAAKAQLVFMVASTAEPLDTPATLAKAASLALTAAGVADVLVLGMGADGHTASLFPDAPNLTDALDLRNTQTCVAIELTHPPANAPYARITQTLAQILSARHIVLPLTGTDKLNTLQQAWQRATPALPIFFVLQQTQTPVALWIAN